MRIFYKLTSRSRPQKLLKCLENITSLARHHDYFIMVTLDIDDDTCNTKEMRDAIAQYPQAKAYWGTSTGKINAINRDLEFSGAWDILVNVSDDQMFLVEGFDIQIIQDMINRVHDSDICLHYPDGTTNERLITMQIMGRMYFERFGYIYHPDYISLYCDQEAMEVAKRLGKYHYIPINIQKHFHPAWGLAEMDEQYRKTESYYNQDRETFIRRLQKNFDLP